MHILNNPKRVYDKKSTLLDIIKIELLLWKCKRIYKKAKISALHEVEDEKRSYVYCIGISRI